MAANAISMKEVKNLVNYSIDNNLELAKNGQTPIAISLEAEAGIGKTSILKQIAEERGMGFTVIRMAQLEEAGDLIGFPQIEYECQVAKKVKDAEGNVKVQILPGTVWLNAKQIDSKDNSTMFRQTGKTRMNYAKPAWVPEYNEKGNLVVLDDYVRANPQLLQACMDLILEQGYISWHLPEKTTICLTNNPDDGTNNVNSLDEAQRTRFLNFNVAFDIDAWMKWAEKAKIDGRCINFVSSYYQELFNADDEGNRICNPRSFVMFANMISGVKDWDDPDSLSFITTISKGCFKDEGGRFSKMFNAFLRNKMHLLIQPKEMLTGKWADVQPKLSAILYDSNGNPRPDISTLLERRFTNFVSAWLDSDEKTPIAVVKDRIVDFIDSEQKGLKMFSKDTLYHMIKKITSDHRNQTNKLLYEPKIANIIS